MSIRRRGDRWQVRVDPFPAETVGSKQSAIRRERLLKERKDLGELWVAPPSTFGQELDRYLERKLQGGRRGLLRPASIRFVRQTLTPWKPLRDVAVPNLHRAMVEDHIRGRAKVAPVAAANELQAAKAALRDAQARGQRVDPGVFALELHRRLGNPGKAIGLADLDRIAAFMPEHVKRIVPFCGTTSLRFGEATRLDESMLDLAGGCLTVPEWLNKSRRNKRVELARAEVALLREQLLARAPGSTLVFPTLAGRPYSNSGFRSIWLPALLGAGFAHVEVDENGVKHVVADLRFHDLRHTATSLMCMAGMRIEHVAERRGDSDGGALVLQRYRHLYGSEMAGAVTAIDGLYANLEREEHRRDHG